MTLAELERATKTNARLCDAQANWDALAEFNVVGIVIDRNGGSLSPIRLERGGCNGTGAVSRIGFPKELGDALTKAMFAYFDEQVSAAQAELHSLGIEVG